MEAAGGCFFAKKSRMLADDDVCCFCCVFLRLRCFFAGTTLETMEEDDGFSGSEGGTLGWGSFLFLGMGLETLRPS